jgi:Subtilase family/Ig domain of plant-specific actin-binding protein
MPRRRAAVTLGAVLAALSLPAATGALEPDGSHRFQLPDPAQVDKHAKVDTELLDLAEGARSRARTVRVEAIARTARRAELEAAVRAAGGTTIARYGRLLEARVPARAVETVAAHPAALRLRTPARPYPQVVGEGVAALGANVWHSAQTRGTGVEIAIVDVGFAGWQALAEDELPETRVTTANFCEDVPFDGDDHGSAVAEIVHELAPGANLHLICVDTLVSLGKAKDYVVANEIPIVNHSVGWPNTSRGDGSGAAGSPDAIVADARAGGVLWINAAGNYADTHWSGTFTDTNSDLLHDYGGGGSGNDVFLAEGGCVYLKWDDWPVSDQDYDLYLFRSSSATPIDASQGLQGGSQEPTEFVCAPTDGAYSFEIHRFNASATPRFDVIVAGGGDLEHNVSSGSLIEPAGSSHALAVGAACVHTNTLLQPYSSRGPTIDDRIKPDLVAPDANSTVTYELSADCTSGFTGTSAAAAHVAGAAALVKQANPGFGAAQLQAALQNTAADVAPPGKDNLWGWGRLQLGAAPAPPPAAPASSALPVVTGLFHQGQPLTGSHGEWTGGVPLLFSFRWFRCDASGAACAAIAGAQSPTYVPGPADHGRTLRLRVTAANAGGAAHALSAPTPAIQTPIQPPANVIAPALAGVAQVGQPLSANSGAWSGTAPLTVTIEWLRCDGAGDGCLVVAGASGASFELGAEDVGRTLRIRVTVENPAGSTSALSAASAVIQPATPTPVTPLGNPPPVTPVPPHGDTATPPQIRLVAVAFSASPRIPRAGQRFALVMRVATRTTSARGAGRRLSCSATLGRTKLRGTKSLRGSVGRCVWKIPKSAGGKRLRSTIVVSEGARSVRRSLAAKVLGPRLR